MKRLMEQRVIGHIRFPASGSKQKDERLRSDENWRH